jgi:hypothetical protein
MGLLPLEDNKESVTAYFGKQLEVTEEINWHQALVEVHWRYGDGTDISN